MVCKICGAQLPEDAEICNECGAAVGEEVTDAIEEGIAVNDGFAEEITEEADEISMVDEISEDVSELEAEDGYATEMVDEEGNIIYFNDVSEVPEMPKRSGIGKVIISLIVVAIVALAAYMGVTEIFGKKDEFAPFIFLKASDKGNCVCVNDYNGNEAKLIEKFGETQTFTKGNDFVVGGKCVFYLNESNLYAYMAGKTDVQKIAETVSSGSIVVSADGKTALFVIHKDEKNILCSYKVGGAVKEIAELDMIKYEAGGKPCYGFLEGTAKDWYIDLKSEKNSGELFVKGKKAAEEVSQMIYISKDAKNIVYLSQNDERRQLMLVDGGKEAETLVEKYSDMSPAYHIGGANNGIIWLADVKEAAEGKGTLYFKAFGKETTAIDTEVGAYITADIMMGNDEEGENDILFYMQGEDILMAKGGKKVALPKDFEYQTANPMFSDDANRMIYTTKDGVLVCSNWTKDGWSDAEEISKDGNAVAVNENADMIAYIETKGEGADAKNALYLYDLKKGAKIDVTDNTVSVPYFGKDGKTLYYTDKMNEDGNSAAANYILGGKAATLHDSINGMIAGTAKDPIIFKIAEEELLEIYTVKDGKLVKITDGVKNVFYY